MLSPPPPQAIGRRAGHAPSALAGVVGAAEAEEHLVLAKEEDGRPGTQFNRNKSVPEFWLEKQLEFCLGIPYTYT